MAPTAMLKAPAESVIARLRVCLAAEALKGRASTKVRADMESIVPMLKRTMYPMRDHAESMVGRSATMTAALPASPWAIPITKDLTRKTGLPITKNALWVSPVGRCVF